MLIHLRAILLTYLLVDSEELVEIVNEKNEVVYPSRYIFMIHIVIQTLVNWITDMLGPAKKWDSIGWYTALLTLLLKIKIIIFMFKKEVY